MSSVSGESLREYAGIGAHQSRRDRLVIRRAERFDEEAARSLFAVRRQAEEATSADATGPNLSPEAGFITGQVLVIDGGITS